MHGTMHVAPLLVKASQTLAENPPMSIRIIALLLVLPCVYFAWQAYQWGVADRYSYEARQIEKQWKKERVTRDSLTAAITKVEKAVEWAPNNSSYRDQIAQFLTMRYLLDRQANTVEQAKKHLLHSRSIRPKSPDNWAAYVELKHYAGEADQALSQAITNAVAAGPWEPNVLQAVTVAGVTHFKTLTAAAQSATIDNIERGLTSKIPRMPSKIVEVIEGAAAGWSLTFTEHVIDMLVNEPWQFRSEPAKTRLALLLWPLQNKRQGDILVVKIAGALESQRGNGLIREVAASGQLPLICLYLTRTPKFDRPCAR
jgi:hypothetical protein